MDIPRYNIICRSGHKYVADLLSNNQLSKKSMEIKILGPSGWEGIPVQFCDCRVCEPAKKKSTSKE